MPEQSVQGTSKTVPGSSKVGVRSVREREISERRKMDIDATTTNTAAAATAEDIEQSFLTQFASICTDDKDNLVDQFQYVLNNEPTTATAKFFLDMNNW